MADFETYITNPAFWQENDGTPKSRETQIKILSELDSKFNALPVNSKNEVIDTYKGKVKPMPVIKTGKVTPGVIDEIPTFMDEVPEIVGGIVGGFMSKTVPGRIIKAGVMGGGGEAVHQLYQHATESPLAPKTSTEAGQRIAQSTIAQGGGQAAGEGLTRVIGKILPKVRPEYLESGIVEPGENLKKFMTKYEQPPGLIRRALGLPAKEKATFTMAQQVDPMSAIVKLETIVENSMFGGYPIKSLKRTQEKAVQDYATSVSDQIWDGLKSISPSEQGNVLVKAFQENINNFHKVGKTFYDNIDELIKIQKPGKVFMYGTVDLIPLNKIVNTFAKSMESRAGLGSSAAGDAFLKKATKLQNNMTFGEAQELRSALLSEQRNLTKGEKASFIINQMVDALDIQMEKTAKNVSPEVYNAWRKANDFWKMGKDKYENDFIRGLVDTAVKNKQPELIGKLIFQNTEVGQVDIVKSALGFNKKTGTWANKEGKEAFQSIKAGWFEELLGKATKMPSGEIAEATQGTAVYESLRKMGGKSKNWWDGESIKSILSPDEIKLIRNFEVATRVAQRKPSGTGGSMLIQLMQSKPLVGGLQLLIGGGMIGGGAFLDNPEVITSGIAILGMPRVVSHMMTKPKYQRLFIEGLNVNKPLTAPILSKILAGAVETKLEIDKYDKLTSEQQTQNTNQPRMIK